MDRFERSGSYCQDQKRLGFLKSEKKNPESKAKRRHSRHDHGQSWMLAAALRDGPLTLEELEDYYRTMGRRFSFLIDLKERKPPAAAGVGHQEDTQLRRNLVRNLGVVIQRGWATEEDGSYHITDEGREQAEVMLKDLEKGGRFFRKAVEPETTSAVTLIVHFVLAALKLPAALISGSVGLLNDSLDTLLDGVSSLFVFFGVRSGKERLVSYILLAFMTVTGAYTLYEAIVRLIKPEPLTVDLTAFVAVAVSALLCALLWVYQRFVGLKHGCIPLIAQSIDSRNHIIVAGGVALGLIAAIFKFNLLDQIVGIVVAVLIVKGAVELFLDLIRSAGDEDIDLSRYGFSRFEKHRHRQTVRWFLYEVKNGHFVSKDDLLHRGIAATDFSKVSSLSAMGLDEQPDRELGLKQAIDALFERKLVEKRLVHHAGSEGNDRGILQLTKAGENELDKALANNTQFGSWRSGPLFRGGLLGFISAFLRIIISIGLFLAVYAAGRWIFAFLPSFDVWGDSALLGTLSITIGSYTVSGAQLICLFAGFLFFYAGRLLLQRSRYSVRNAYDSERKPYYLVTDGLYSYMRHPMYAGMILIGIGLGIGLHSMYSLAWAALVAIVRIINTIAEENKLKVWFAEEYNGYASRVKRHLFPWWAAFLAVIFYALAWIGLAGA